MLGRLGPRKKREKGGVKGKLASLRMISLGAGKEGNMPGERMLRDCAMSTALWTIIAENCEMEELYDGKDNAFLWLGSEGAGQKLHALLKREDFAKRFINAQDERGQTLLHRAVEWKLPHIVTALLECPHLDTEICDREGRTAFQLASREGAGDAIQGMLAKEGVWVPCEARTSPYFQMGALRRCRSLRGVVFPYGFSESIRGVDIRDADLSRTRVTSYSLRNVRDLSGVRLPKGATPRPPPGCGVWGEGLPPAFPARLSGAIQPRHARERIPLRKVSRLCGGVTLKGADLSETSLTWEEIGGYAVYYGVIFPDSFDMSRMDGLGWKRFLYCDFSHCLNYPYDFHLRAGQAHGLRYPPLDFRKAHFEGCDMTDSDFSAQIPPDHRMNMEGENAEEEKGA